jgi:hypothetical protein
MKFAENSQEVLVTKGFNPINRFKFPKYYESSGGVDLAAINPIGPPFPTSLVCFTVHLVTYFALINF